jgi:hypothetical protein
LLGHITQNQLVSSNKHKHPTFYADTTKTLIDEIDKSINVQDALEQIPDF